MMCESRTLEWGIFVEWQCYNNITRQSRLRDISKDTQWMYSWNSVDIAGRIIMLAARLNGKEDRS